MGLFDKRKKGDDFDSPVENIDLSAPPAQPEPQAIPAAAAPAERQIEAEPPPDEDYDAPAYGIDDAIQLMRALPGDNVELVVQVVKRTLESTKVKVKTIIDDASRKQSDIEGRIDVLKKEITEYEQEIATRKEEIEKLEADHKETTLVKDRLQLAEKLTNSSSAPASPRQAPTPTKPPAVTSPAPPVTHPRPGGTIPPGTANSSNSPTASGTTQSQTPKGTTIVAKK